MAQRTYPLRLPDPLRDRVKSAAQTHDRSVNEQITHYVRKGLAAEKEADERKTGCG